MKMFQQSYLKVYHQKPNTELESSRNHGTQGSRSSLTPSFQSFKTASTHFYVPSISDTSTETVVDWSTAASTRRPEPSLHRPSSAASIPRIPFFPQRPAPNNAIPAAKTERKAEAKPSSLVAQSSTISNPTTVTSSRMSRSSASMGQWPNDPVIQWSIGSENPSLKKSPRMIDLSEGIESATAQVLQAGEYVLEEDINGPRRAGSVVQRRADAGEHRLAKPKSRGQIAESHAISESDTAGRATTLYPPPPKNDSYHSCTRAAEIAAVLMKEIASLRSEIQQNFQEQREWMDRRLEEHAKHRH